MDKILKYSGLVALVILAIVYVSNVFGNSTSFGAAASCATDVTCFTKLAALTSFQSDGTLQIGSSGTSMTQVLNGTCNLIGTYSAAATTTTNYDCAVTGVVAGDRVFVSAPSTIPCVAGVGCFAPIEGAFASSTSGFVTIPVFNGSGVASSTIGGNLITGWKYLIVR